MGYRPPPLPPFTPHPSFELWVDWAKHNYVAGKMSLAEFMAWLDRHVADDERWSPLPGGPNALNADGKLLIQYGDRVRDFTFEYIVECR